MPGWSIALIGWSTMGWLVACYQLGVLRQWHHYWIGAALVVAAALLHWPTWLQGVGGVVALDDAGQHWVQLVTANLAYRSPLHLAYRYLLYDPWQRVTRARGG